MKAVIVRTTKEYKREDGSYIRFDDNAAVILTPRARTRSARASLGSVARELRDKGFSRILSLAPESL